jgi:lysophospholipase L1-like esterase
MRAMKLPNNSPLNYLKNREEVQGTRKIVVLVGDSITHGKIGVNYVDVLTERIDENFYQLINAGRNSELAWNVLQRVEEIIRCKPDIVTIMIGTNDAKGELTEKEQKSYVRRMKLPRKPDHDWFHENVLSLVETLKKNTTAQIALMSIPVLGEDCNHPAFIQSSEYSKTIKKIAQSKNVTYLPFNEEMIAYLARRPKKLGPPFVNVDFRILKSIYKKYLFGRSWDYISRSSGFELLTDHVHLNSKAAEIAANLIENFIMSISA